MGPNFWNADWSRSDDRKMSSPRDREPSAVSPEMTASDREACREMFEKVTEYLNGELAGEPSTSPGTGATPYCSELCCYVWWSPPAEKSTYFTK